MSSAIGPSLTTPTRVSETTGPASSSAPGTPSPPPGTSGRPLLQSLTADVFRSAPLGIRMPNNSEDFAIILAQAALAIDEASKTIRNQRIEVQAAAVRSGLGVAFGALESADKELAAKQAERAKADADRKEARKEEGNLVGTIASLTARIEGLDEAIAAAKKAGDKDEVARLNGLRREAVADRSEAIGDLAGVRAEIAAFDAAITNYDEVVIPEFQARLELARFALLTTFSQVALLLQDADGQIARDSMEDMSLDKRFEELSDTLKEFQQNAIDRDQADAQRSEQASEAQASQRVLQAALGLITGLSEIRDLLAAAAPEPALNTREAALASGQRFQLAL